MSQPVQPARPAHTGSPGLGMLVLLFVLSGCSALIYEIVWFQLLELVIGSSAISLGILLAMFMGGMCLGSLAAPGVVSPRRNPLRAYAAIEIAIGAIGLILLYAMPLVAGLYTASAGNWAVQWTGQGAASMILRGVVAGFCLLPPAALMGATLPVISRWVRATPEGVSGLGYFYGGNIAGAVVGCLLTGFLLLRFYDVSIATYVAVTLNIVVALLSLKLAGTLPNTGFAAEPSGKAELPSASGSWAVYAVVAISGMTALAAEVIWTRLLSLLFGATVYAFALILAVFLLGLGLGATVGSAIGARAARPRLLLGWCQLALCAAIAWSAWQLFAVLPYSTVNPIRASETSYVVRLELLRSIWAMLPAAILWGASFPLALAALVPRHAAEATDEVRRPDPALLVGRAYGLNTVGAIIGAIGAALWLVQAYGSRHSQQILIAVTAVSGLLALAPLAKSAAAPAKAFAVAVLVTTLVGSALIWFMPQMPPELIAYGRRLTGPRHDAQVVEAREGLTGAIAVSHGENDVWNYHNAGKIQASTEWPDMRLQRTLGHLTTLVPPNPHNFLVIGMGAGVTAGAVSIEPKMERMTIVEIEPLVPRVVAPYFKAYNFDLLDNPNVQVRIDDGRHFLLTTNEKFDGITSDPLDPWVKGAAALYTREFFEAARRRLNPGGVMTQFVQLYESSEDAVKSEIATFVEVFPHALVFANTVEGQGYDLVLLGQVEPRRIDIDRMEKLLETPEYSRVARSLREIGFYSASDLLATFVAQGADLKPWLSDAVLNRDRNLRLQYLAGAGLNRTDAGAIYNHIVSAIPGGPHLPDQVFTGSDDLMEYLGRAVQYGTSR